MKKKWYEKISSGNSDVNMHSKSKTTYKTYSFGNLIGWVVRKVKGEK